MRIAVTRARVIVAILLGALVMVPAANAAPVASFDGFVEAPPSVNQHAVGDVMYLMPSIVGTGSFTVNIHAVDPVDGINRVEFPSFGDPTWSPAGGVDMTGPPPYQFTYTWSGLAPEPGNVNAVVFSNSGASVSVPFEVRVDSSPPTGGSISTADGFTNGTSVLVAGIAPTDLQSGLESFWFKRRSAPLTPSGCGLSGSWTAIGPAGPALPYVDATIADASCYQYQMESRDMVGNGTTITSPGTVKVDRTAPVGSISALPVAPFVGDVTLSGTAHDSAAGLMGVDVRYSGPSNGDICLSPPTPQTWACSWDTSGLAPGAYTVELIVTDLAGNVGAPITRSVFVDAPTDEVQVDTPAGTSVTEGDPGVTFDIVLDSAPASNVTITYTTDSQLFVSPSSSTFTPANWNVPQQVTVDAIDDMVDEGMHDGQVTITTASADPTFDSLPVTPLTFDVTDNDVAGVVMTPGTGEVAEAGATSDTFSVMLTSQPTAQVTLDVTVDTQVDVTPSSLIFTPMSWNIPQSVTVTAVDDAIDEADPHTTSVTFEVSSADATYAALAVPDVDVTVVDDDAGAGSATATFEGFAEGAGPGFQHASGSTMWFNPAQAGSFTVSATGTATPSLTSITFPMLGAGWVPGAPVVTTAAPHAATYAWSAGAASSSTHAITATSSDLSTGTASFSVAADAAPPVGVTIAAQSTTTRDTSVPVTGDHGTDGQSGIGTWRFQRRSAALAADTCGAWGAWTDLGAANPAGPISDAALPDSSCLQYRHVVSDNVGNQSTAEQSGELKVDRTAPIATIDALPGRVHGTVTITGTAHDATTNVRSVAVVLEDQYSICTSAPLDATGRWTCSWTIGPREFGAASIKVTVTDGAGQRASVSQQTTMVEPPSPFGPVQGQVDTTAPIVGIARMPLVSWTDSVRVVASARDERDGTIEIRVEQRAARAVGGSFSPWAPSFEESELVPLEKRGSTHCFRGIAVDESGNKAMSDQRCTTLPLDDADLKAKGPWDTVSDERAWLGSQRVSAKAGAQLWIKVIDPTPTLVFTKCSACGVVKVFHGKRLVRTYTLKAKKTRYRQTVTLPALDNPLGAPLRIVAANDRPVMVDALVANR